MTLPTSSIAKVMNGMHYMSLLNQLIWFERANDPTYRRYYL